MYVFHREIGNPIDLAHLEYFDNIGMLEPGSHTAFIEEKFTKMSNVSGGLVVNELQRDLFTEAPRAKAKGPIDGAHSTRSHDLADLERAERRTVIFSISSNHHPALRIP